MDGHVHPSGLDVGGVEPPGQRNQHRALDGEPVIGNLSHSPVDAGVDALLDPQRRPLVELGEGLGRTGGRALLEEPLLHVPKVAWMRFISSPG